MFIIWKMPSTPKVTEWDIDVVYRDLVLLRSRHGDCTSFIDLITGEGMVVKPLRDQWRVTKFKVSDSLNDVLFDCLDGIEVWGVRGGGGVAA